MAKRVAIQKGLDTLKLELINLGYDVVDMETGSNPEAIIYMSENYETLYQNQIIDLASGEKAGNSEGVLLINANGKDINEIDTIIKNRVYDKLF